MEKDWVVLKIDDCRMWASLSIKEPIGEESTYFSPEFIEGYLKENGITTGLIREAIGALSNCVAYGTDVVVARGKEPINGRDGFYKYMVPLEDSKNKPTINEDGSVDYYNSLNLAMVEEGDVFAVYEPATKGEYGYTIFAEMLPPVKGKELRPLRGKGFHVDEDERTYIASYSGRIYKQQERVVVEKMYIVKGDLDIEQGNIRFNGDVEIKGDVRSGLSIETEGDIFIHGHVGACQLTAGGSITIRKGVQGRNKCNIVAGKSIACSFIERCNITAGENVYADSILDSEVVARQKIIVSSKKGVIVGGNVLGVQGVISKMAGNAAGMPTQITAGVVAEDFEKLTHISESMKKIQEEMALLDKNLKVFDQLDGSKRTKETESMRMKIFRVKIIKSTEYKKLQEQYHFLESEIERARSEAMVHITGTSYVGVKVVIGRASLTNKESFKDIVYKNRNEEIIIMSGDEL